MKRLIMITFAMLALTAGLAACSTDEPGIPGTEQPPTPERPATPGGENNPSEGNEGEEENMSNKLKITVGSTVFNAMLEENATAKAFKALLPMTIDMRELNGNEKYYYFSSGLPTNSSRPGTIRNGDLMMYGSDCLVLFYKTFSSSYSYSRLGRVENASGLEAALGSGGVRVSFELH